MRLRLNQLILMELILVRTKETVTGTTGTWIQVETDGEQEIKQVSFDAVNQRMIIGDDAKIYAINGSQMIIDDMDREAFDRIVLSK